MSVCALVGLVITRHQKTLSLSKLKIQRDSMIRHHSIALQSPRPTVHASHRDRADSGAMASTHPHHFFLPFAFVIRAWTMMRCQPHCVFTGSRSQSPSLHVSEAAQNSGSNSLAALSPRRP